MDSSKLVSERIQPQQEQEKSMEEENQLENSSQQQPKELIPPPTEQLPCKGKGKTQSISDFSLSDKGSSKQTQ